MAFENPFLQPSSVRKSALSYLWSDEPQNVPMESDSVVNNVFKVSDSVPIAENVLGNIVANGGEYNSDDSTDYSSYTQNNPVEAWKAYDQYGTKVLSTLGKLGVPFTGAIGSALEQSFANNYNDLIGNMVNQFGGETVDQSSPAMAALKKLGVSMIPVVGKYIDTSSEDFNIMKSLRDQFGTTDATTGYFAAALDPTISQIAQGVVADPTTITPAQFGTIGSEIQNKIYENVAKGMDLNAAQAAAVDFFNPPTAVSIPVPSPVMPTPTPLAPAGSGLLAPSNVPDSVINQANQSQDPIGSLINQISPPPSSSGSGLLAPSNVSDSVINQANQSPDPIGSLINQISPSTSSGGSGGGNTPSGSGGGVTDSSGNAVTDSSGNQVQTRDYNSSSSSSSSSSGGCCFIMLEARYGDGTMDSVVRKYRDEMMTDRNRRGYYKLAEVFVPLMRKSNVFKFLVKKTFADPLVSYGKWYYKENKHGWLFAPVKTLWIKVFNIIGGDTKFIRENGKVV